MSVNKYTHNKSNSGPGFIANIIFFSRWLQLPIYLGLIVAQVVYSIKFLKMLWSFIDNFSILDDDQIIIVVLNLIDILMVVNLLVMTIIGGYEIFVSRLHTQNHPDQPEWLNHVNASVLKVKLAISIVAISSIHLLQVFMNIDRMTESAIKWAVIIHLTFIVSAIGVAYTDRILYSTVHKTQ